MGDRSDSPGLAGFGGGRWAGKGGELLFDIDDSRAPPFPLQSVFTRSEFPRMRFQAENGGVTLPPHAAPWAWVASPLLGTKSPHTRRALVGDRPLPTGPTHAPRGS